MGLALVTALVMAVVRGGGRQPAEPARQHHHDAPDEGGAEQPHRGHGQAEGRSALETQPRIGGAHRGGGSMAAFVGHFDQAGHQGVDPQPGLQHQQHQQPGHEVLAEGQDEGQQQLGRKRTP